MHGFQGDVILIAVDSFSKTKIIPRKERGYVLAEGETTGHAHVVLDDIDLFEDNGKMFLHADNEFTITHEEHNAVKVPAGDYEVRIAQEYDHFAEEAKRVQD